MSDAVISNELNKQSSGRLLSIDLLRAVAAFGVFLFHASLTAGFDKFSLSIPIPGLDRAIAIPNFLSLGAMGVSLFFVVSGYCLARSRYRGGSAATSLWGYYTSRVHRIYPAYFFSLLVTLLVWWLVAGTSAMWQPSDDGRPALLLDFFVHSAFLQGFSSTHFLSFNGTLWSMATEVQFYILFPLLFPLVRGGGGRIVLLVLAGCLLIRYLSGATPSLAALVEGGVAKSVLISYSVLGRLSEFVVGMWVALLHMERRLPSIRIWKVAGLFVVAAVATWRAVGWLSEPMWGLAFGSLLVWAIHEVDPRAVQMTSRFRCVRTCRAFGIYSYSFFLIHWVILFLFDGIPWFHLADGWVKFFVAGVACFGLSYVLAKWMYLNIESRDVPSKEGLNNCRHPREGGDPALHVIESKEAGFPPSRE